MTFIIIFFLPHLPNLYLHFLLFHLVFIFFSLSLSSSLYSCLPPLLPSRYLLVYFYPSHQTSNSVSLWWVWERSGQTSWWKLIKHFWKSILTADGSRTAFSPTSAPSSAHAPLLPRACPIWSSLLAENSLLLHIFVLNLSLVVWEQSF